MIEDIKIALLGTTGAGKTSYLLGMYAVMQTGIQGFTLAAKDMDADLDLTERWEQLIATAGEDRWPAPNAAEMEKYSFIFSYGFRPLIGFEWLDYRGLALSDRSEEADVKELSNYLTQSQCLFLCVSGEYLADKLTPTTVRQLKSDRMNQFIQQYVSRDLLPSPNRPFPIAIIITKYDLCQHREKQEIIADIKRLFQALFTPNSGWLVMICPVSLGKELGEDPNNGDIVPVNVHLPIVFAVYAQLRKWGIELKEKRDRSEQKVEAMKKTNVLWQLLKEREIKTQTAELQECETNLTTVEKNMKLLAEELQQVSLFFSGNEVTADV